MKIIFDNSESAAPVAPLLLAVEEQTEEQAEEFVDAMEAIEEAEENLPKRGFGK